MKIMKFPDLDLSLRACAQKSLNFIRSFLEFHSSSWVGEFLELISLMKSTILSFQIKIFREELFMWKNEAFSKPQSFFKDKALKKSFIEFLSKEEYSEPFRRAFSSRRFNPIMKKI